MARLKRLRTSASLFFLTACLGLVCQISAAQDAGANHPVNSDSTGRGKWREVPVDPLTQSDDIPPALRAKRNNFWKRTLPSSNDVVSPGAFLVGAPEIPQFDGLWIVGTFESYKTFLASADQGPYTEIRLRINSVINNSTTARVSVGDGIDIGEPGGAVKKPAGKVQTYNLHLTPSPFEPQHQYILLLMYDPKLGYFDDERRWDVTSGKVVPDGSVEFSVYEEGRSQLVGLSTSDAITKIKAILSNRK